MPIADESRSTVEGTGTVEPPTQLATRIGKRLADRIGDQPALFLVIALVAFAVSMTALGVAVGRSEATSLLGWTALAVGLGSVSLLIVGVLIGRTWRIGPIAYDPATGGRWSVVAILAVVLGGILAGVALAPPVGLALVTAGVLIVLNRSTPPLQSGAALALGVGLALVVVSVPVIGIRSVNPSLRAVALIVAVGGLTAAKLALRCTAGALVDFVLSNDEISVAGIDDGGMIETSRACRTVDDTTWSAEEVRREAIRGESDSADELFTRLVIADGEQQCILDLDEDGCFDPSAWVAAQAALSLRALAGGVLLVFVGSLSLFLGLARVRFRWIEVLIPEPPVRR